MATFVESFSFGTRTEQGYPGPDSPEGRRTSRHSRSPHFLEQEDVGIDWTCFPYDFRKGLHAQLEKTKIHTPRVGSNSWTLGAAVNVVEQVLHIVAEER
jgi:hypothetical protein